MGKIGSIWFFGVFSPVANVKILGFIAFLPAPVTIFSENALFRQNVISYIIIMPQCVA